MAKEGCDGPELIVDLRHRGGDDAIMHVVCEGDYTKNGLCRKDREDSENGFFVQSVVMWDYYL